jgi:hypothetical protein
MGSPKSATLSLRIGGNTSEHAVRAFTPSAIAARSLDPFESLR